MVSELIEQSGIFFFRLNGSHFVSIEEKENSAALKKMRQEMGQIMRTDVFDEAVGATSGYSTNLWVIAAV